MDEKLKDKETLLAVDKTDENKVKAVKGVTENGDLITVEPTETNASEFIQIDDKAGILENFFSNLKREFQDPTHFQFFRAPIEGIENIANLFKELFKDENGNSIFLTQNRENPEDYQKPEEKQTQTQKATDMAESREYQPVDESKVNWDQLEKLGVTRQMLEESGNLKAMLHWHKSPTLIEVTPVFEGIPFPTQARLYFEEKADGSIGLKADTLLPAPQLDKPLHGVMLTDEDKKNILETGNAGRIIPLTHNKIPCYVSLDTLTNRLIAVPVSKVTFNETLKGANLTDDHLKALYAGKKTLVEGMISKYGKPFDGYVQFNAAKGSLDFSYDGLNRNRYSQRQEGEKTSKTNEKQQKFRIPQILKGKRLTEDQQIDLGNRKTIYVTGMTDNAGKPFNAYIQVNDEKGKLDFFKWNPDRAKKVTPDNNSRTQVAVNSEGKTNETTKHLKEPLKQGQQNPTENQQQNMRKIVKKSSGQKI